MLAKNAPKTARLLETGNGVTASALLIAFGDLYAPSGTVVPGRQVLLSLLNANMWLTNRMPLRARTPINCLFYQSGVGIVARARVTGAGSANSVPLSAAPGIPEGWFAMALTLEDVDIFNRPLDVRPFIQQLSFVSDKKYWGHAFRSTPRLILKKDFDLLLKEAKRAR